MTRTAPRSGGNAETTAPASTAPAGITAPAATTLPKRPPRSVAATTPQSQSTTPQLRGKVSFGAVGSGAGHRIVPFGPGGVGKTTLACTVPGKVAVFDLDDSLPRLREKFKAWDIPEPLVVPGIDSWQALLTALLSDGWDGVGTIVIDSGSKAEELAAAHVLATVRTQDGQVAANIESYGYGKGYRHLYDTFNAILPILDRHAAAGRNVIIVCHECTSEVPNPRGPEWKRYEPQLYTSDSGKNSIRLRVKEWADHMLFIGYDIDVSKDGVGKGGGTATVYPVELPFAMAKSRTLTEQMKLEDAIWNLWPKLLV